MSNAVNGVIEAINFRPINADGSPNQWEKTHRSSLQVGGVWYGSGQCKPSPRGELQMRVQKGKDWVTLAVGDTVQFFTKSRDSGGKTYYDTEGKIMLVAQGNGAPAPAPRAATPAPTASGAAPATRPTSASPDAMQTRIENGQAFNLAIEIALSRGVEVNVANLLPLLAGVHALRDKVAALGWGRTTAVDVPAAPTPPPAAPVAVPPAAVVDMGFNDDDIPF